MNDFLELKNHAVTFPLMGHIVFSLFASVITAITGKEKPALHLQGSSGCGKTFVATRAMAFFGKFGESLPSWSATANALEAEGYWFRDALFLIDDYKPPIVPQETVIRIFQGYADSHGRLRLKPNSQIQKHQYIRGGLVSTGEDFVSDLESVTGRTICLQVEPKKNEPAGANCLKLQDIYPMFPPALIASVISRPDWKERIKTFVDKKIPELGEETKGLPNGLRIAAGWSLNAVAFEMFLDFLLKLGAIDKDKKSQLEKEYMDIVRSHLQDQAQKLMSESPAEVFLRVIGQKLSAGTISIKGLEGNGATSRGKVIGFVKGKSVNIFPDVAMEVVSSHFRSLSQRVPFTINSLRNALVQGELITRPPEKGRVTRQVREEGGRRVRVWEFGLEEFKKNISIE